MLLRSSVIVFRVSKYCKKRDTRATFTIRRKSFMNRTHADIDSIIEETSPHIQPDKQKFLTFCYIYGYNTILLSRLTAQ